MSETAPRPSAPPPSLPAALAHVVVARSPCQLMSLSQRSASIAPTRWRPGRSTMSDAPSRVTAGALSSPSPSPSRTHSRNGLAPSSSLSAKLPSLAAKKRESSQLRSAASGKFCARHADVSASRSTRSSLPAARAKGSSSSSVREATHASLGSAARADAMAARSSAVAAAPSSSDASVCD